MAQNALKAKEKKCPEPRTHPAVFILAVISAIALLYPFIVPLILAVITAYVFRPIVKRLEEHTRSYHLALILIVAVIAVPIVSAVSYISANSLIFLGDISEIGNALKAIIFSLSDWISTTGFGTYASYFLSAQDVMDKITRFVIGIAQGFVKNIPIYFIDFVIYLYAAYHFMLSGPKIVRFIKEYAATLSSEDAHFISSIMRGLKRSFDVLFLSYITMSLINTVVSFIGYSLLGVPHAFVLSLITGLFGFLPVFAVWMVYVPVAAYFYSIGNVAGALGVMVFGIVVLTIFLPFVLQPYLGAKKSGVNALTILLGFFSGPLIFGAKGLLLGPILFVMIETIIIEYMKYRIETAKTGRIQP